MHKEELLKVLALAISLGLKFKYIPDDEGDGYTLTVGDKSFYDAKEALEFCQD